MLKILLDAADGNLLLGFMPESLGLLIFGVTLIFIAVALRRMFDRSDEHRAEKSLNNRREEISR